MIQDFFNWITSLFNSKIKPSTPDQILAAPPAPMLPGKPGESHPALKLWKPEWTSGILPLIKQLLPTLDRASDILTIRPDYNYLTETNKALVWIELFKAMTKFESNFNQKSSSVDVGTQGKKDTYSVGLMQVSVIDQENLGIRLGYTYDDLLDPVKNLTLATKIMVNQIAKRGKAMIKQGEKGNPGLYWAVLHPGGKYDHSQAIISYVQFLKFGIVVPPEVEVPVVVPTIAAKKWFMDRLGWSENNAEQNKELAKGWVLTKYCKAFKTCQGSEHAWCGMSMATAMKSAGYKYPEQCETAYEWAKYGTQHDWKSFGIPEGAIIVHDSSHVNMCYQTMAKGGKSVMCIGGNQADKISIKSYSVSGIRAVRLPVK